MRRTLVAMVLCVALAGPTVAMASPSLERIESLMQSSGFSGKVIASQGDIPMSVSRGKFAPNARWRWASVTKQIVATLVMQEVGNGTIDLDKPVSSYLPGFKSANAGTITVRQLLRHQTGLPNPDESAAGKDGVPTYYVSTDPASHDPLTGYCAGPIKNAAGGDWSYNNCDFIVAGALLQAVTKTPWQKLVAERIAKLLGLTTLAAFPARNPTVKGTVAGKAEGKYRFENFGAAASLYGIPEDLWKFDRALITGKLLADAQRAEMWDGQPNLGFIALGQWSFGAELKGCTLPVRIIERRGAIGGVQVRNFILPDADVVVIAFANRDDFDFGEIWQGKGFAFDLLSAAACAS